MKCVFEIKIINLGEIGNIVSENLFSVEFFLLILMCVVFKKIFNV